MPRVKVEPLAEDRQPSAPQRELADGAAATERPGQPDRSAKLGIEAAAAYEDLLRRIDGQVEVSPLPPPLPAAAGLIASVLLLAPRPARSCA